MAAEAGPGLFGSGTLTRNWIVFHRPDTPSYTHAGLLMALGLAGHLTKLAWTDLYRCWLLTCPCYCFVISVYHSLKVSG